MLPLLAEAHIIDHAINTIVAEIRMYFLHEWMQLLCSKRTFSSEKIQNCLGEDSMYRPLSNPKLDEYVIGISQCLLEELAGRP